MERWVKLFATSVVVALATAGSPNKPALGSSLDFLEGTQLTRAPYGYTQFCRDYPQDCLGGDVLPAAVDLTENRLREIDRINRQVNRDVRPVTDLELHGVTEIWSFPIDGAGDCEDYVLEKRDRLMDHGWPGQALMITVVLDKRGDGHAVLTARTTGGDLILDNQHPDIRLWSETEYRFVKRQAEWNTNRWVSITPPADQRPYVTAGNQSEGPPPPR